MARRTAGVIVTLAALVSGCSLGTSGVGISDDAAAVDPVVVTALGDSIPAASNCLGCAAFVDLFAGHIAERSGQSVDVVNMGVPGATSTDLLDSLLLDPEYTSVVRGTNVLTVTIGANDFFPELDPYFAGECDGLGCFDDDLVALGETLDGVLREILELRSDADVLVTGYWNVFPDGAVAEDLFGAQFLRDSAELTRRANAVIESAATGGGARYVDLVGPFKGRDGSGDPTRLLSDDGEHPNQAGHEAISDAVWATLDNRRDR